MTSSQFNRLTQINLDDIASSFDLRSGGFPARFAQWIFLKHAQTFARQMVEFDSVTGNSGLAEGARAVLKHHYDDVRVHRSDLIPASGFLALSNHPGLADSVATFAALNRPDLRIIALQRPFLEALTNVSKRLFYVNDNASSRMTLVRQVSAFLRSGGAVLTYPAGHIEPDPDFHSDATESLQQWTDSVGIFLRMSPETPILPILVRGVVWKKAMTHPLTRIRKTRMEREALAAAFQVFAMMRGKIKDVRVRVQIGNPIYARQLGTTETNAIHQVVLTEMKRLIENPPTDYGKSIF